MSSKVNHDIRSNDGGTIYHLPENAGALGQGNLQIPNVYESDASPGLYPIGTRFVDGERVFHYSYAGDDITSTLLGVVGYKAGQAQAVGSYDTAQPAGVGTVASPLKVNGSALGTPAKNAWAGMYILILTSIALGRPTMRIVSNTISAYDVTHDTQETTQLVLDQPTPEAIADNTPVDIYTNRYADIRMPYPLAIGMYPFQGVNLIPVASGRYFWLQTWGPCFVTYNNTSPGDVAWDRTVTWRVDGSLGMLDEDLHTKQLNSQIAGYVLTADGTGSDWLMLMCDR